MKTMFPLVFSRCGNASLDMWTGALRRRSHSSSKYSMGESRMVSKMHFPALLIRTSRPSETIQHILRNRSSPIWKFLPPKCLTVSFTAASLSSDLVMSLVRTSTSVAPSFLKKDASKIVLHHV